MFGQGYTAHLPRHLRTKLVGKERPSDDALAQAVRHPQLPVARCRQRKRYLLPLVGIVNVCSWVCWRRHISEGLSMAGLDTMVRIKFE
jgi:hypothetical protein